MCVLNVGFNKIRTVYARSSKWIESGKELEAWVEDTNERETLAGGLTSLKQVERAKARVEIHRQASKKHRGEDTNEWTATNGWCQLITAVDTPAIASMARMTVVGGPASR
uniref:Uncharacterized protein n=1 Tax=Mycena chlorophos TaxID=658473 RepID=A0ABQ0KYR5_MYCCL|nr:predicted protein [Mycena chlorophos]